jgi:hypothetical protein
MNMGKAGQKKKRLYRERTETLLATDFATRDLPICHVFTHMRKLTPARGGGQKHSCSHDCFLHDKKGTYLSVEAASSCV